MKLITTNSKSLAFVVALAFAQTTTKLAPQVLNRIEIGRLHSSIDVSNFLIRQIISTGHRCVLWTVVLRQDKRLAANSGHWSASVESGYLYAGTRANASCH